MSAPEFVVDVRPKRMDTCEGSAARFTAKVKGQPFPKCQWWCDEEKVEDSFKTKVEIDSETGDVSVTIHAAEPDHQGVWKLVIANDKGQTESIGVLGVEFDPTVEHE